MVEVTGCETLDNGADLSLVENLIEIGDIAFGAFKALSGEIDEIIF